MIPYRVRYAAPGSVDGCVAELASGDARLMAGGTWVVPELSRGDSAPGVLVDLRHAGLRQVTHGAEGLWLGAMTTYSDLLADETVATHAPVLRVLARGITGGRALHTQGTVGGSAMAGRPQADVPGALVALGAMAEVVGVDGRRRVPVAEVVAATGAGRARPDEVVTGFRLPSTAGARHGYVKIKRGTSSWPIATATALVSLDADGLVAAASVTLGAVSRTPLVVPLTDLFEGVDVSWPGSVDEERWRAVAERAGDVDDPWEDELAPARYRAAVAGPAAVRAVRRAMEERP